MNSISIDVILNDIHFLVIVQGNLMYNIAYIFKNILSYKFGYCMHIYSF